MYLETNGTNGTLAEHREELEEFLHKLSNTGNVRLSCEAAGIPRSTAYRWRDKWITFAEAWEEALDDACDRLEAEAWRRAIEDGSDRLLMFLLKAHRPDRYTPREKHEISGEGGEALKIEYINDWRRKRSGE